MGYLLLGLFLYILYRFTVGFLLPVIRTTSELKRKVQDMQNGRQPGGESSYAAEDPASASQSDQDRGEYIDFEEIKE